MVAVCGNYLFTCGKTSNMQLSKKKKKEKNNLSLQAIWLEVNWSMTDPIYSVSRWFIFFCCYVIVLVSLLNRMFAFVLHPEYITSRFMAKRVVWHNFQSSSKKQARQTFHCFVLNSYFIQPSECKDVPFVCVSVRLQVSFIPLRFRYFVGAFLSAQLIYRGKVELCHPFDDFRGNDFRNYFSRTL